MSSTLDSFKDDEGLVDSKNIVLDSYGNMTVSGEEVECMIEMKELVPILKSYTTLWSSCKLYLQKKQ